MVESLTWSGFHEVVLMLDGLRADMIRRMIRCNEKSHSKAMAESNKCVEKSPHEG